MAIHSAHYHALKELHSLGELPQDCRILEIGEANFYGDVPLSTIANDGHLLRDEAQAIQIERQLRPARPDLFAVAKAVYRVFFGECKTTAIDLNGTELAWKLDLNEPLSILTKQSSGYDVTINHGTAEHIFNVANVFRVMHDHTAVGGLMIHESPFTGWVDHGFYTIQPTLYYDLAAANGYDIRYLAVTSLGHPLPVRVEGREQLLELAKLGSVPDNSMLFVAIRKTTDEPFKIPMQGYYTAQISDEAKRAWHAMR